MSGATNSVILKNPLLNSAAAVPCAAVSTRRILEVLTDWTVTSTSMNLFHVVQARGAEKPSTESESSGSGMVFVQSRQTCMGF